MAKSCWVETSIHLFAVCGPKYTSLRHGMSETLQFITPFASELSQSQ